MTAEDEFLAKVNSPPPPETPVANAIVETYENAVLIGVGLPLLVMLFFTVGYFKVTIDNGHLLPILVLAEILAVCA